MKSKDLQNVVLPKYQTGDTSTKKIRDLNGGNGLRTIKPWRQMILQSGSITLSSPPGVHVWPERKEIFESPDLNPLDYSIWDELVNSINWNKVQSKTTLIQQINSSFKNIRESVVFESCASFTNRLYRLCQNDGNYLG
ncbi:unnamed protein product [Rotaria magnacalcarata]|uniref:Uncharacterized protein n=2 Tax=Rotaria magnacalcarata TaxID=392030 RepID=A0A8S3DLR5_9BILA|nr:unnamed protein product [Rotaria magnacalcarata]CAF4985035.1 unnamed protein product [Rotaria magnacalcarata]